MQQNITSTLAPVATAHAPRENARVFERVASLLGLLIFVGLLMLVVVCPIAYGTVDLWWEALFECATFALVALWVVSSVVGGRWQLNLRWLVVAPLIAITAYAFLQTISWPPSFLAGDASHSGSHTLTIDRFQTYITARKSLSLTVFF